MLKKENLNFALEVWTNTAWMLNICET